MIVDWFKCGVLDVGLLAGETIVNVLLAINLKNAGFYLQFQGILILSVLPSFVNASIWLSNLRKSYPFDSLRVLLFVFFGFPSPLFVYVWSIYLNVFGHKSRKRSRIAANTFRIVQALVYSVPALIINITTLIGTLKSIDQHGNPTLNIDSLHTHIVEVKIHGLAFAFGFLNVLRAASLFNERKTFTLLFVAAGFPFLLFSSLARILAAGFITTFLRIEWICLAVIILLSSNLLLYILCQKRSTANHSLDDSDEPSCEEVEPADSKKSFRESYFNSECFRHLPKYLILSVCSVFIPCAYSNDRMSHHPRIKGGTFILLNYLINGLIFAGSLGFTILHFTPDDIHGISLPQPSLNVQVPGSKVFVKALGLDVGVRLPNTNIDLGSMPAVTANVDTSGTDKIFASVIPLILSILPLPFVVIRAAMMELDCFIIKKKEFDKCACEIAKDRRRDEKNNGLGDSTLLNHRRGAEREINKSDAIVELARKSLHDPSVKIRLYLSICFGFLGMIVLTIFSLTSVALIVVNMKA